METANIKFNGGIWSEVLKGRYDLGNYQSASRTCENFIPNRYGQVEKRSGTKHLGYAKEDDRVCVLYPFQYSVNTKFILEMGDQYIRFWSNDLQVTLSNPTNWFVNSSTVIGNKRDFAGNAYVCIRDYYPFKAWDTLLEYKVNSLVKYSGSFYICTGVTTALDPDPATDIANWDQITSPSDAPAYWYLLDTDDAGEYILEFPTPYLEADLYELQIRAVNDVVYIVHPDYPVGKLIRLADDEWAYETADLSLPFVDPDVNSTEVTLTPSATTGNGIAITASDDAFDATHVGSVLRLKYIDDGSSYNFSDFNAYALSSQFNPLTVYATSSTSRNVYELRGGSRFFYRCVQAYDATATWSAGVYAVNDLVTFSGDAYICIATTSGGTGDPATATGFWDQVISPDDVPYYFDVGFRSMSAKSVSGSWSYKTTGIWTGIIAIQRSVDGGTNWATIRTLSSTADSNYLLEEDEEGASDVKIRVNWLSCKDSGSNNQNTTFSILSTDVYGTAEVVTVTDAQNVVADVVTTLPEADTTVSWQESAFSEYQGYPRSIALFDNRLLLAGTRKRPQAFFYSGINDYNNFLARTTLADAPFFVEALSDDQSSIQWLSAQRELFVGTASVEGILATRKQDEAQSPENLPIVRWNESMGSAHRAALPMRDSLMCLQRGRTTINMLAYSLERDGYTGEEVSLLCNHLFASGVQQMAHLREPYTGAYTIQEDGTLCHMVYEPKLQVTGWCKFTTQNGDFESVAVLPSSGSDEDEVWCVVKREVNGDTKRHIERFTIDNRAKQEALDTDNLWYVDAGVKATGTDLTSVSGLDHLEGETVCVLADGIKGEYVVSGGAITLSIPADTVIVGLPVVSEFEPLDLEVTYKGGSTYGKRKQLYQSKLMLHKSLGGSIAYDSESYQELIYHTAGEAMDSSIPLKSGYSEVFAEGGHSRQKFWRIKHAEPYPFTLQAVIQSFTMGKH